MGYAIPGLNEGKLMSDLIFILLIIGFFVASERYIRFCGKL